MSLLQKTSPCKHPDPPPIVSGTNFARGGGRSEQAIDFMKERGPYDDKETRMTATLPPSVTEETLQGFTYFRVLGPLFAPLRTVCSLRFIPLAST